jgi:hypothetical protein
LSPISLDFLSAGWLQSVTILSGKQRQRQKVGK